MLPRSSPQVPSNILLHWYAVVDGFQFSSQEFYRSVLDELAARNLPRLKSSHVEYHEGGALSDKRIYLRLARERYAFDVCAAPIGTGYFFSMRVVEVPRGGWLKFIGLLLIAFLLWRGFTLISADTYWWILLALAVVALGGLILRPSREDSKTPSAPQTRRALLPDFDSFFLGLPVIGGLYEYWRKDTYYRYDTRLLFLTIVLEIVIRRVAEVTAANGVKLVKTYDYNPIFSELYKPGFLKSGNESGDGRAHGLD